MTTDIPEDHQGNKPLALGSTEGLGPLVDPVTLADVLDALNLFNRPKPSEDDGPWEGGHFIRVDYLPAFINIIAAAWFAPALTDEQIDAGIEAWFTTDITTNDGKDRGHPFRQRMRAALDRARGRGPNVRANLEPTHDQA